MFIFLRLLLAHFIGDYPLQFNKVYSLKFKGFAGVIPHVLLVTISFIILCWPYLNIGLLWIFILFIAVIHLVQDWLKIKCSTVTIDNYLWFYLLDQVLHIAALSLIFLTPIKNVSAPKEINIITSLYNNNILVIYLIALIVATYNGLYLITNIKKTFMNIMDMYPPFEKWYGIAERAVILSLFLNIKMLVLLPLVLLLRPAVFYFVSKKYNINKRFVSCWETAASWLIALITGVCFHIILHKFYLN
ncbi:MAG: hypothetical protein B1H08_05380 [Candidatus Omnitrophica bacterium 4484_171]|nr:MAG: hypothetical protein B1H08_05380 [Candidatus Omnitrophica bacterium 4484_171]